MMDSSQLSRKRLHAGKIWENLVDELFVKCGQPVGSRVPQFSRLYDTTDLGIFPNWISFFEISAE